MWSYVSLLMPIILVVLASKVKSIHWTDAKEANKQMILQFVIYTVAFASLIFTHYTIYSTGQSPVLLFVLFIGLSVMTLYQLCRKVPENNRIPVIPETATALLKIIAFTWYGIFITLCCINYCLIVSFPEAYGGLEGLRFYERAFNSVYYTFSVMMTYTGNGITATGILSRSIEIVEVLCCYVFIGIAVTNVIGKSTETRPAKKQKYNADGGLGK